jgi:peptidoglycan/LPS O-acetylase OafA/YrhL
VVVLISRDGIAAQGTPGRGRPGDRLGYQSSLEGLRGLAVLLVLAVHLGEFVVPSTGDWFFPGGFIGVDIFFVLSGFLIGAILIDELDGSGVMRVGRFYGRRIVRLVPALLLLLGVHYLYAAWSTHAPLGAERSIDSYALLFVSNWRNSLGVGRIGDMVHLWSVAMEMQWYLVAPLIVFVLHRYVRRTDRILAVLVASTVCVAVLRYVEYAWWNDWSMVHERSDARADTFLVGLIVAFLWRRGLLRAPVVRIVGALGLGTIAAVCFAAQANKAAPSPYLLEWGNTLVAVAAAALVAVCLVPGSRIARGFDARPLRVIGRISYSLYLWHLPVYFWVATHVDVPAVFEMLVALALSFGIATTAYFIAEYPVLRSRPRALARVGSSP